MSATESRAATLPAVNQSRYGTAPDGLPSDQHAPHVTTENVGYCAACPCGLLRWSANKATAVAWVDEHAKKHRPESEET